LLKRTPEGSKNLLGKNLDIEGRAELFPPTSIGDNVSIRNNCKIGPNVVIGDNVYIGKNTNIKNALIYGETYISDDVQIEDAIISNDCNIESDVTLKGNGRNLVILSSFVRVNEGVTLKSPDNDCISVCHHEVVKRDLK
jgi:NDP-sugar pyrophosphorylase family protein